MGKRVERTLSLFLRVCLALSETIVDYEGFERLLAVKRKGCLFVQNGRGGMGVWECEFDEENTISSGDN